MKNQCSYLLLLLLSLAGLTQVGCEKCKDARNPECSNYDPCLDARPPLTFKIEEFSGATGSAGARLGRWFETDLMSDDPDVRISTDVEADSLLWIFGIEEIKTRSFIRSGGFPASSAIPCTLITYRKPNRLCKPNDDGRDTLIKWFTTSRPNYKSNLIGTYRGLIVEKPLEGAFDVRIGDAYPPHLGDFLYIENLPERNTTSRVGFGYSLFENSRPNGSALEATYWSLRTNGVEYYGNYPQTKGFAWLHHKDTDSITIEMEYRKSSIEAYQKITFIGKRIL